MRPLLGWLNANERNIDLVARLLLVACTLLEFVLHRGADVGTLAPTLYTATHRVLLTVMAPLIILVLMPWVRRWL